MCQNCILFSLFFPLRIGTMSEGSSHCGSVVTNPTSIHEDAGLTSGFDQCAKELALP